MTTSVLVDTASPVHHTDTVDTAWDGGAAEKNLPSPMTVATAKATYGWYDSAQVDGGELPKAAAKLPHHEVSADGTPGAANLPGVRNALSRLPQSDIPESEQDAVRKHLQAHLDDEETEEGEPADTAATPAVTGRRRLHAPARLRDLVRPGATFKHDPPSNRAAAERWRIVNHDGGGPAEIWLYDEIGFWGVSAEMFCQALAELDADEILLRVNSPGGDVFDGTAMYNALLDHPATVTCRVEGMAASAASFIAQAADKIIMGRGAEMMVHDASGLCIGNSADMLETAAILDRVSDGIASIYHDRAGGSAKSWRDVMRGEQWYTADEAVSAGLADEVAAAPKKRGAEPAAARAERPSAGWDLSLFRYPGRAAAPAPAAAQVRIVASTVPAGFAPVCDEDTADPQIPADFPEAYIVEDGQPGKDWDDNAGETSEPDAAEPTAAQPDADAPAAAAALPPELVDTFARLLTEAARIAAATPTTGDSPPAARAFPGTTAAGQPDNANDDEWAGLVAGLHQPDKPDQPDAVDALLEQLRGDTR